MRTAPFWDITHQVAVIPYGRFGTTYLLQIEGQESKKIQESKKKAGFHP
jgi:hypothetical protein